MLINNLMSDLAKEKLAQKMQYKLGYTLLSAVRKAAKQQPLDFETKAPSTEAADSLKLAKKRFASFQDYCQTNSWQVDTLEAIIQSFINNSGKPVGHVDADVIKQRAKLSGLSLDKLSASADQARLVAIGQAEEEFAHLKGELMDLTIYANGFYHNDAAISNMPEDDMGDPYVDLEDIMVDGWIVENYPKVVKSQTAFWNKYNRWDDAEASFMSADMEMIKASKA